MLQAPDITDLFAFIEGACDGDVKEHVWWCFFSQTLFPETGEIWMTRVFWKKKNPACLLSPWLPFVRDIYHILSRSVQGTLLRQGPESVPRQASCHALSQSQDNIILKFRSKYSWVTRGIQILARSVLLKRSKGTEVKTWSLALTQGQFCSVCDSLMRY